MQENEFIEPVQIRRNTKKAFWDHVFVLSSIYQIYTNVSKNNISRNIEKNIYIRKDFLFWKNSLRLIKSWGDILIDLALSSIDPGFSIKLPILANTLS